MTTKIHYTMLDPNDIFGSVGRCGGGYNTAWEDWSTEGRRIREEIMEQFEQGMNQICGHYDKLEQDIVLNGFRNPIVITCGEPNRREHKHLPPELLAQPKTEWLIMEGSSGGSRLWVAQKHNIPVPCIINDNTGRFSDLPELTTREQIKSLFTDPPETIRLTPKGVGISQLAKTHIDDKWGDEMTLDAERRPMWEAIMAKYGFDVKNKPQPKKKPTKKPKQCFIVGGGPSLTGFDWSQLDGEFVIAINRAYEVLPNADIVYFTDDNWYREHKDALAQHSGQLIKGSTRVPSNVDNNVVEYKLASETGLQTRINTLSHGSNSTYAAINLAAVHLGYKEIYLLGIDMQHSGNQSHWHDGHTRVDPESAYDRMISNFAQMVPLLKSRSVKVYNVNTPQQTKLTCFPFSDRVTLAEPVPVIEQTTYMPPARSKLKTNPDLVQQRKRQLDEIRKINRNRKKQF